jgi:hypothetical protein
VAALYFASRGELASLLEGYLTLNMEMTRQVVGGVGRALFVTLERTLRIPWLALLLPAAVVGTVHLWRNDRRACVLLVAWSLGMALCIAAQRRYWPYHWHALAWSLGPLAGIGLARLLRADTAERASRVVAVALMALALFTLVFPLQRRVREWTQLVRGQFPTRAAYLRQFVGGESEIVDDDLSLAAWLSTNSAVGDRVFIWDSPLANVIAQRRTPGRFGFFGPLVLGSSDLNRPVPLGPIQQRMRLEFLGTLDDARTRFVVVSGNAMAGNEPSRKNVPVLFPELSTVLAERWQVTDSVGDYRILTRRAAGP